MFKYDSIDALRVAAEKAGKRISDVVLADQAEAMECSPEDVKKQAAEMIAVMRDAIRSGMKKDLRSVSGLSGGDAWKMGERAKGETLSGGFLARAIARTLAVSEYNAAMGKIVAAPTAGSCGIIPGTLISLLEEGKCDENAAVMALIMSAGLGIVIAQNASIAGASGGCQAECGSACAMAAAALVEASGGSPRQVVNACALALKSLLGLACDPVAGLVEVPCIKRNASSVAIAFTCADMALAGIESKIPVDECVDAMKRIGDDMNRNIKETAEGGLAATATGERLAKQIFG